MPASTAAAAKEAIWGMLVSTSSEAPLGLLKLVQGSWMSWLMITLINPAYAVPRHN